MTVIGFSKEFEHAWDRWHNARADARAVTVEEMRRFLPEGCTRIVVEWTSDADSGRLYLHELLAEDGTVMADDALDERLTEAGAWDAIDELCSYMADDWEDADDRLLRQPHPDPKIQWYPNRFYIDFEEPAESLEIVSVGILTKDGYQELPAGSDE